MTSPSSLRAALAERFGLHHDIADHAELDQALRGGVELRGATPWILMFAIVIASIGLNTNSTAVIIGAMLISPLMGPIVGIGYGFGILDFALIRRSLLNLAIAAAISLATSTLYFLLTPLSEAQSELLARTTPSLWDVLIALAGGLAGIIGLTRRERTTVIPGVAIATALMPPLCTAGYGLANGNWQVFGGAFYLFSINCVFIAFSAMLVIDFLRLPHRKFIDPKVERRVKRTLLAVVLLTALPSIYLALRLVDNEVFNSRARRFVQAELQNGRTQVVAVHPDGAARRIDVTLIGARFAPDALRAVQAKLAAAGLEQTRLVVHQAENQKIDVAALKTDLLADVYRQSQAQLAERERSIADLRATLQERDAWRATARDIAAELSAQLPECGAALAGESWRTGADGAQERVPFLSARCAKPVSRAARERIERWLRVRAHASEVRLQLDFGRAARRGK